VSKQLQKEADFYKNFIEVQNIYKFVRKLSLSLRIINQFDTPGGRDSERLLCHRGGADV
jgi:hypothetical protein